MKSLLVMILFVCSVASALIAMLGIIDLMYPRLFAKGVNYEMLDWMLIFVGMFGYVVGQYLVIELRDKIYDEVYGRKRKV